MDLSEQLSLFLLLTIHWKKLSHDTLKFNLKNKLNSDMWREGNQPAILDKLHYVWNINFNRALLTAVTFLKNKKENICKVCFFSETDAGWHIK